MRRDKVDIGFMDVPIDYLNFNDEMKNRFCDRMIDSMLYVIEKELISAPEINRIYFLDSILDSSLESNLENEAFEIACIIRDMRKRLALDT